MSFPIGEVDEETLEKIRSDLGEDPKRLEKYVSLFKEWLKGEKHLPEDTDDRFIENFIRLCKYDLEKSKAKFEQYIIGKYGLEHLREGFVVGKECFEEDDIFKSIIIAPELNPDLTRTIYMIGTDRVETFNYKCRQRYFVDLMEWLLHRGLSIGKGFIIIGDLQCCTTQLITKLDLGVEKQYHDLLINTFPAVIKQVHLCNVPLAAKPFVAMFRAVCSEKMKKRMIFHDHVRGLKSYLPKDALPVEYGGDPGKSVYGWGRSWAELYVTTGEIQETVKALRLRGQIPKHKLHLDPSSGFGFNGSFRQLQLD